MTDPCDGVTCPSNAACRGGTCECNSCYDDTGTDPNTVVCTSRQCGVNETCRVSTDACGCSGGHHSHPGHEACHPVGVHPGSCGDDQVGTPGNCRDCGAGSVPNAARTECVRCSDTDQVETAAGGSCRDCGDGTEANGAGTACSACGTDEAGTGGSCDPCVLGEVPNSARTACVDCPAETAANPGQCPPASCGPNEWGTPPNCTECLAGEVPNATNDGCDPAGTQGGTGHCTRLGRYTEGSEVHCARWGLLVNARCEFVTECPANSADNGSGVCVCDPGFAFNNSAPGTHGTTWFYPRVCTARTAALCGVATEPGTCAGTGGTWDSGAATCSCPEGMEPDADRQSCACPDGDEEEALVPRLSVLFPNPQSLFDGLQVGFVNTSSGNLTFRRRDIVTRAQGPVVFARVHDSRIAENADFGPGWRLSLAEELLVDGDAVTYVDDAGARHTFVWQNTGYMNSPSTPRHASTTLAFEDIGGVRVATMVDGETTRTFERADETGTRYVVRTVATRARTLEFGYDGGRLATVSHEGATLFQIDRDADGHIAELRDNHGRNVRYAYDAEGRLETVRDLAGSDWRYLYGDDGRLGGAVDPLDRPYLAASYDEAGRVTQAYSGPLHAYDYGAESTTVTEGVGDAHTLTRTPTGISTGLSSTGGASWGIALDAMNRVATLTLPERTLAYTHDGDGRVETTTETAADGTVTTRAYEYDARGRLTAVTGDDGPVTVTYVHNNVHVMSGDSAFEYDLDDRGRVVAVRQGAGDELRIERNVAGDVEAFSRGIRVVRLGRDALGRVADTAFPGGESARYLYGELGSPTLVERGNGTSTAYDHDAVGDIAVVAATGWDGSVRRLAVAGGPDEPVAHGGPAMTGVGGETASRSEVVEFRGGGRTVVVEHDTEGSVARVSGTSTVREWERPDPGGIGQTCGRRAGRSGRSPRRGAGEGSTSRCAEGRPAFGRAAGLRDRCLRRAPARGHPGSGGFGGALAGCADIARECVHASRRGCRSEVRRDVQRVVPARGTRSRGRRVHA